ncbi:MAG: hypothetical protein Q9207_000489 [Kuettlingeria erythrocarpa]
MPWPYALSPASAAPAASPPVLASRPSTLSRPVAMSATAPQGPTIFTHKEWIVPPRPKPGRKPAADNPPTKRKAQNRQAQRAFRERRAARVGELEEQIQKMEEDAKEQTGLRAQISQLESALHSHNELLLSWRQRMQELEATIKEERRLREAAENQSGILPNGQNHDSDAVPLRPRKPNGYKLQAEGEDSVVESKALDPYPDGSMGCGKCSLGTRCECLEQSFDMGVFATTSDLPNKRPHSPPTEDEDNKRFHQHPSQQPEDNEIDFTTPFLSNKAPDLITSASSASLPAAAPNPDPCGFCQDGTPCICAEMTMEANNSESQSSTFINKAAASAPANPCIKGAGTCDKCLSDANSTLFCKSLAATRLGYRPDQPTLSESKEHGLTNQELPPTPSSDTEFPPLETEPKRIQAIAGVTLSCADSYEILSRHPAFQRASEQPSTWMPQLATIPGENERTAFEVEAASVLGVLKFFDRKFRNNVERHES